MRVKVEIHNPTGYPYLLYNVSDKEGRERFVPGCNEKQAIQLSGLKKGKARPGKISDLMNIYGGRSETHRALKSVSDKWILKNGMVFFKDIKS